MDKSLDDRVNNWIDYVQGLPYLCKVKLFENGELVTLKGELFPRFTNGDFVGTTSEPVPMAEALTLGAHWYDAQHFLYYLMECAIGSGSVM